LYGAAPALASERVVVETSSGRVFTGRFDHRTSSERLVLRAGSSDMYLLRAIDWRRVTRVRVDGKPLQAADLLARFDAQGWPRVAEELPAPARSVPPPPEPRLPRPSDASAAPTGIPGWESARSGPARARSMHLEASVGKWRGYADNDGIVVRVSPRDADGNIVPVSGTLAVDLIGTQSATMTRGQPFPRLARWVRRVEPQDIVGYGATYRLPFQARHPEFDLELGSIGAVHARLIVPGQGVFDDTASTVWIRPFSATRDQLQMHTGGRFFAPIERTSRGMNGSRLGVIAPP
jgi:hypothetical protein